MSNLFTNWIFRPIVIVLAGQIALHAMYLVDYFPDTYLATYVANVINQPLEDITFRAQLVLTILFGVMILSFYEMAMHYWFRPVAPDTAELETQSPEFPDDAITASAGYGSRYRMTSLAAAAEEAHLKTKDSTFAKRGETYRPRQGNPRTDEILLWYANAIKQHYPIWGCEVPSVISHKLDLKNFILEVENGKIHARKVTGNAMITNLEVRRSDVQAFIKRVRNLPDNDS